MNTFTRFLWSGAIIIVLAACSGCCSCKHDSLLSSLSGYQLIGFKPAFKCAPYIQAAAELQKMGPDDACRRMQIFALTHDDDAEQIHILCRMLFVKKNGAEFRRPRIGEPVFLDGQHGSDVGNNYWPLEPIEIVDGVPFIVEWGYTLSGTPEDAEKYLLYCMENCTWNTYQYHEKTRDEIRRALKQLLADPRWSRPLNGQERNLLIKQTE